MGSSSEKALPGRLFIPSLSISNFAVFISGPLLALLTVDIASDLYVSVSVAAQIVSVNAIAEVVVGLAIGFLAVKYRHKSLLLTGVALVAISAIGGFFAPTYLWMQFCFFLEGAGTVMVVIMSRTLVGDSLALSEKPKAMSYLVAITASVAVVATPIMGFLASIGSWRSVFSLFVLPMSAVSFALAVFGVPRKAKTQNSVGNVSAMPPFKQVFQDKSATFSLVGSLLVGAVAPVGVFVVAFYREALLGSIGVGTLAVVSAGLTYILGALIAGRITNRFGTKILVLLGFSVSGILLILLFSISNLWISFVLNAVHVTFFSMAFTASRCLILDQIKTSRSTMVSAGTVLANIGQILGPVVGGAVLVLFSYQAVGLAMGAFGISAALIFYFLTRDPYKVLARA
jgi:DHA1 family bicyclomycin/chloramphenicol resistance-like MFS transporter